MDHQPGPSPEPAELAPVIDINEVRAERQTPAEAAKARLDELSVQYNLPRADDGVHITLDVLTGFNPNDRQHVLKQIMDAEQAYDDAFRPADSPGLVDTDEPVPPSAAAEHTS